MITTFLVLILTAIRFLTVEADESWNLLSVGQLAGAPFAPKGVLSAAVVTSGGLYAAIHYPLILAGLPIEVHRLMSFMFAVLTLATVYRIIRAQGAETWVGLFGVVAFMTVPGFLLQAGMAMAEMISTFLLIIGAWYWTNRGNSTLAGSAIAGVLFGMSCATRTSALIVLPAIAVWALLFGRRLLRPILHTLVACGVAFAVYAFCTAVYYILFHFTGSNEFTKYLGFSTGASYYRGPTSWMAYFLTSANLFPFLALVVSAVALALGPPAGTFAKTRSFCVLLVSIGVIGWVAWIVKAPIPHLRYLYPALPALWLAGTLLLSGWLTVLESGRPRILLQVAVVSAWAAQFAISFREVYYGDSLAIVYEAVGLSPEKNRLAFFAARQDQEKLVSVVTGLPDDARICALIKEVSYPITLLTGRRFESLSDSVRTNENCSYLVMFPSDKNVWVPTSATEEWIRDNTNTYKRFGDYAIYEIKPGAPELANPPEVRIGEQEHPGYTK
jgi:4-amino-4-deoxy-L-arabinose transferase-like glycosyltransferase